LSKAIVINHWPALLNRVRTGSQIIGKYVGEALPGSTCERGQMSSAFYILPCVSTFLRNTKSGYIRWIVEFGIFLWEQAGNLDSAQTTHIIVRVFPDFFVSSLSNDLVE